MTNYGQIYCFFYLASSWLLSCRLSAFNATVRLAGMNEYRKHIHKTLLHMLCSEFKMRLKWLVTMMKRYAYGTAMSCLAVRAFTFQRTLCTQNGFFIWLWLHFSGTILLQAFFACLLWSRQLSMEWLMHLGCLSLCYDDFFVSWMGLMVMFDWQWVCVCVGPMPLWQSHLSVSWNRNSMTTYVHVNDM